MKVLQDLHTSDDKIKRDFRKNENRRLSAMWRHLRKQDQYDLIGDYPMLAHIITICSEIKIKFTRGEIINALSFSKEYKSFGKKMKMDLINNLMALGGSK